jgi:flagellar biosynthesis regulator FlaF
MRSTTHTPPPLTRAVPALVPPRPTSNPRSKLDGIAMAPADVRQARVSLEQVSTRLRHENDARAVFPDLYAVITKIVEREIADDTGFFLEPDFISHLVAEFARRYLETLAWTVEGRAQDCSAWALAYDYCRVDNVTPLQHAALGIGAHINFDLALGIHTTIRRLGASGDPAKLARYKHDHDAVNELLAESLPEALDRLEQLYGCSMTGLLGGRMRRHAIRLALDALRRWRELVWTNVVEMLQAPDEQTRHRVVLCMERRSRRIGHRLCAVRAVHLVLRFATSILDPQRPAGAAVPMDSDVRLPEMSGA